MTGPIEEGRSIYRKEFGCRDPPISKRKSDSKKCALRQRQAASLLSLTNIFQVKGIVYSKIKKKMKTVTLIKWLLADVSEIIFATAKKGLTFL